MRFTLTVLTSPIGSLRLVREAPHLASRLYEHGVKILKIRRRGNLCIMCMESSHNPIPITLIISLIVALGILIVAYMLIKGVEEALPEIGRMVALYGPPIAISMAAVYVGYVLQKTI